MVGEWASFAGLEEVDREGVVVAKGDVELERIDAVSIA